MVTRRLFVLTGLGAAAARAADDPTGGDPFGSLQWPGLRREFFGDAPVVFDPGVAVRAPAFAEDAMNVPIAVDAAALDGVEAIVVFVDRNPIRRVLEYVPVAAAPGIAFRIKLEQASPVRAAARTSDGRWHVGGTRVDASGGGCSAAGATRRDGSWAQTLGQVSARVFPGAAPAGSRLRLMVMHPMDTGLVGGIPAFYLSRLSLRDAQDRELLRLATYEPISENPVFGFDFARRPPGPLRLVGADNNGNRIDVKIE
jgi:sulfur-oxidizing protein SoxY